MHSCQGPEHRVAHCAAGNDDAAAYLLLDDADATGGVSLTQDEMAQLLGFTRTAIDRGFAKLRRNGLIDNRHGVTWIVDRKALTKLPG